MPITILTGLPGAGKSRRLIDTVNARRGRGHPVLTFACSDSPILMSRPALREHARLACRIPNITCPLSHFVSAAEAASILGEVRPDTLVAFEESQFFGPAMVQPWLDASNRGLELIIATPSPEQLDALKHNGCEESRLFLTCQQCRSADATTFVCLPEEDATLAMCNPCYAQMTRDARCEILERLERQEPHPGEKAIYQPVELDECSDWKVLRPDSQARFRLMTHVLHEAGIQGESPATYLDVGCNTGYFCHHMRRLGFYAEGTDVVKGDIKVARLLDSFFRRDHNTYVAADAYDYLRDTADRQFDVTSAFSVFQWVMMQRSPEDGITCLERLFAKTKRVCFLEMGDSSEAHYKDRIGIDINRSWTQEIMKEKGGFPEVRLLGAQEHGIKRDIFAGIKT